MPPANRPLPFRMDPCGFRGLGLALRTTIVTQASERLGVALSVDDRIKDRKAGIPGGIDGCAVQLHIHLIEQLLHPQ